MKDYSEAISEEARHFCPAGRCPGVVLGCGSASNRRARRRPHLFGVNRFIPSAQRRCASLDVHSSRSAQKLPLIDPTCFTCQSLGVPILQNTRHERFAQLVASGKHSDMEAFKQAGYADESAHQNACRLRANESVAARIEELRARNAEKCQLSRDEAVRYLVEILKTPIAEVTADHRLAQSYEFRRLTRQDSRRPGLSARQSAPLEESSPQGKPRRIPPSRATPNIQPESDEA